MLEPDCPHDVYIKGLCGKCGVMLEPPQSTSVSMIHSVPELKVSEDYARQIGKDDQHRLMRDRKLVLLVDLDQTLLHTTHEEIKQTPDIHTFQLWPNHPRYHTKLRPYLKQFLEEVSQLYELHIFTFGCREYAHKIASIIDPDKKFFGNRILSRNESVDQFYKKKNLSNLFPCGDAMVCIIDDRSDVWREAGNLLKVKPYVYFNSSISDGAQKSATSEGSDKEEKQLSKLKELLGFDDDDDDDDDDNADDVHAEEGEEISDSEGKSASEKDLKDDDTDQDEDEMSIDEPAKQEELPEDRDDYLLHLPNTLKLIHEEWYKALDEECRYLADGENFKLPDIKDIIRKHVKPLFRKT